MRLPSTAAVFVLALMIVFAAPAPAQTSGDPGSAGFTIEDIRIQSAQRVADGTILNYLPARTGETFDQEDAARALHALYKSGLFTDVRLLRDGGTLVVDVAERPAVGEINISGDYSMDEDKLRASLKQIGLAPGRIFRRSLLDKTRQQLRGVLYSKGKYGLKLKTDVRELPRNRVAIDINLREGKQTTIRQIKILGNDKFSDETLKEQMQLGIPSWWAFLSSMDEYSRAKLQGDLESIRSYYLDRGYIKFNIDSSNVQITPDKKDIYITIRVDEGKQYHVRDTSLSGKLPVPKKTLEKRISLDKGDLFSRKEVTASRKAIADRLAQDGYAFANINVSPEVDESDHTVAIDFYVAPGKRAYVRRITFSGQNSTQDRVYRRELRQFEGGLYSPSHLDRTKVRLQRLPQARKVAMSTKRVPGNADQIDVNYDITERQTGSLRLGAGLSSALGVTFNIGIKQRNLFGTGKTLSARIDTTEINRTLRVNFTDPYWTEWGVSRTLRFKYKEADPNDVTDTADYYSDNGDLGVGFGVPLSEYNTLDFGADVLLTRIRTIDDTPQPVLDTLDEKDDTFHALRLNIGFSRDTRNRTIFADSGTRNSLSFKATTPGSDFEYYKLSYKFENYIPLFDPFVLSSQLHVAYGDGYGDTEKLPFYRRYYAGGIRSVRGYESSSLAPRYTQAEASDNDPKGGDFLTTGTVELIFPPTFVKSNGQTRLSVFFDFGNVFAEPGDFESGRLRTSAGIAFNWRSPIGPLSVSYAKPLNAKSIDDKQSFQFTIGTLF